MTFRAYKLFPLFLVSCIFVSCVTINYETGNSLIPTNQVFTLETQDFEVPMFTQKADSMYMAYPTSLALGSINSPLFGNTTTGGIFTFLPYNIEEDYGENPVVENLYVDLLVSGVDVMDDSQRYIPQNIYVYKLVKDINHMEIYSSSFTEDYIDPVPVSKPGLIYQGGDTLHLEFTPEFAAELLEANKTQRDSATAFLDRYKGLYICTDALSSGGRMNYLTIGESYMYLDYTVAGKDSLLTYELNSYTTYFNTSTHDSQELITTEPSEFTYYEGQSGVKPCVDIPALIREIELWGSSQVPVVERNRILVSRAELVVPVEIPQGEDYTLVDHAPSMLFPAYMVRTDSLTYYTPLSDLYNKEPGGVLNRTKWEYTFDITAYMQLLLTTDDSKLNDFANLWLLGVEYVEEDSSDDYSDYYNNYYGGYGGYGGYGYGGYGYGYGGYGYGYGYDPYSSYYGYGGYYNTSSSSSSGSYTVDNYSYRNMRLCGNLSDRAPYVRISYSVLLK